MPDKELKRLSRAELIDIIYELQKINEEEKLQNQKLKEKLEEKEIRIATFGSIAEAAVKVNGVLEAAQAAADQYLESIRAANADSDIKLVAAEKRRSEILQDANQKAAEIIHSAEKKAEDIENETSKLYDKRWNEFQEKANEFVKVHSELSLLIKKEK